MSATPSPPPSGAAPGHAEGTDDAPRPITGPNDAPGAADADVTRWPALEPSSISGVVTSSDVIVCVGSGGVGKTTVAAAIGLMGARAGRRTAVVTIDPARRLADALGTGELGNDPRRIDGPWPGELWASMLDTRATFDALVARYAVDRAQEERIVANRFYRNISNALSGTQEYMAAEKLYELSESGRFDLVVVDTPPTRSALDFLDASNQLTRFLDHRVYRMLTSPGRGVVKALNRTVQGLLRMATRIVGAEVLDDAVAFFAAFDGIEEGFRQRSQHIRERLGQPSSSFVLVAAARGDTLAEARWFAERLREAQIAVRALVVNRLHPSFGSTSAEDIRARLDDAPAELATLLANWADLRALADAEADHVRALARDLAVPTVPVPLLERDVTDLDALGSIADALDARR
ncbi:MAG: ArsA-related P-loop ATPase [Actinomycetota bacterium]|nr:ArsA-related P-loop ATPase [Actinomycetota bacterium]